MGHRGLRVSWILTALLVVPVVLLIIFAIAPNPGEDLPDSADVKTMTAKLINSPKGLPDVPEFEVGAADVSSILESLQPARRDYLPDSWQVLGDVTITTKEGRCLQVRLFWTAENKGAFALGPRGKRAYYRGGTDSAIENAVRNAYANFKDSERGHRTP
jgi:hypothetical protein